MTASSKSRTRAKQALEATAAAAASNSSKTEQQEPMDVDSAGAGASANTSARSKKTAATATAAATVSKETKVQQAKSKTSQARSNASSAAQPKRANAAPVTSATNSSTNSGSAQQRPSAAAAAAAAQPVPAAAPVHVVPGGATYVPPLVDSDYSLTRIIEEYGERNDLLKLVLAAKTEQDRARAEYEKRIQEELRFETRRLEFEMMLHRNYFKQQEREQEEKRIQIMQQQQMPPPTTAHRSDIVLQSPLPPSVAQQQAPHLHHQPPGHMPPPMATGLMPPPAPYGMPAQAQHDPYNMRSYHHPDTPGGFDARTHSTSFAFFKQPLGTTIHHPSAYVVPGEPSASVAAPPNTADPKARRLADGSAAANGNGNSNSNSSSGGSAVLGSGLLQVPNRPLAPATTAHGRLGIKDRRPVPPAVSGLSVRIMGNDHSMSDSPRSAPVDGPNQLKRKISHDEVIMALRRKVMSKGNQISAQAQQPQKSGSGRGASSKAATASDAAPTSPTAARNGSQKQQKEQASSSRLKVPAQPALRERRSSLAIVTDISTADVLASSSSSSSSSAESSPATSRAGELGDTSADAAAGSSERLPSISTIIVPSAQAREATPAGSDAA